MSGSPVLRLTLRDGRPVALRPISRDDRDRLRDGFEDLSDDSRQLRFLGAVSSLSDATLDYLTDVDGVDHVAWGALDLEHPRAPGFGVGRFIRLDDAPDTAEFSLTVLDTAQGHGVGHLLLATLVVEAERVGVRVLRGVIGHENKKMAKWMRRLGASADDDGQDFVMDLALPVDPEASTTAADFVATVGTLREAMAAAARSETTPDA